MAPKKEKSDFAGKFKELESIAEWFEKGEPDIEEGMKRVERASKLAEELKKVLDEAENKIKLIRDKQEK
jgi:exodeoxyribonuclease VII small subunit